jgi:prevent-host-death family protein
MAAIGAFLPSTSLTHATAMPCAFKLPFDMESDQRQTSQKSSLFGEFMHSWPVQDAKARFSEFLDACLTAGPQMVTKRGAEAAVLVPVQEWRRLQFSARPSLKQLLLSDDGRADMLVAPRGVAKRRTVEPQG